MNKIALLKSMRKNLSPMLQTNNEVRKLLIHLVNHAEEDPELLVKAVPELEKSIQFLDSNAVVYQKLIGD